MVVYVSSVLLGKLVGHSVGRATVCAALSFASLLYDQASDSTSLGSYICLNSTILRRLYGTRILYRALALLSELGALEIDDSYMSMETAKRLGLSADHAYSKGYRLTPEFQNNVVESDIAAPLLEARIDKALIAASYTAMNGKARGWVIETYKHRTSFTPFAEQLLAGLTFENNMARHRGVTAYRKTRDHTVRFTQGRKRSGRIFYPITSLPRDLRPELLIDGQPTCEIDVSACQPTLLATLYQPDSKERADYLAFVSRRDFYETFGRWAGEDWDRGECKREFFNQISYGSGYCADRYKLLPPFAAKFPELAAIMVGIKQGVGGNSALPLRMQRLESEIVIDGAIGECAERGVPALPVHDSLVVKVSDASVVADVMARHWLAKTGFPARIKGVPNQIE